MIEFVKKIKTYDDFCSANGATEEAITEAEKALNLHFSDEFKKYLTEYGTASADGHEFTGIISSPRLNVVDVTEKNRVKNPNARGSLYVVEEMQIDGITVWQSEDGSVYFSTGNQEPQKTNSSLAEYISSLPT